MTSLPATITLVSAANVTVIDQLALAQSFGGRVASVLNDRRQAVPVTPHYRVQADIHGTQSRSFEYGVQPVVGVLLVKADAESLLARVWRRVATVLIRESGF